MPSSSIGFKDNFQLVKKIWSKIEGNKRTQIYFLLLTMIFSALAEIITISSIVPFLNFISNPDYLLDIKWFRFILSSLNINSSDNFLLASTLIFATCLALAVSIRLLNLYLSCRISASIGSDFSRRVFSRTLNQPFKSYLKQNSSEVISAITFHIKITVSAINQTLQIITSFFISLALLFALFSINVSLPLLCIFILGTYYLLIVKILKNKLRKNGIIIREANDIQVKSIQESLGSFRDVILSNSQELLIKSFFKTDKKMRNALAINIFFGSFPRYTLEAIALIFISFSSFLISISTDNNTNHLVVIGALALCLQRLLPALQTIYQAWSVINANYPSVKNILNFLEKPVYFYPNLDKEDKYPFKESIKIKNLNFKYEDESQLILENINFFINKGDRVGIVGETGSGKSTLIDIMMGLLNPSSGGIFVDGKNLYSKNNEKNLACWQRSIAHVPQNIFLVDGSILENITFGIPIRDIDYEKVKKVTKQANLELFIKGLKYGFETKIGENGISLSGGQRQRIGIARALYRDANILFLDEATSALDVKTEEEVMQSIYKLSDDLTIFIIAHRITTLNKCTKIIEINKN